ncbi:MAG: hypothetical protein AAGC53_03095 [Actinomycetota bacterium]
MNLSTTQFATLAQAAAAVGGRARTDFLADGMRTVPCVAIEAVDLKGVWNLSSLLAERDAGLSRALRGPAIEPAGRRSTLYWPGVTAD